MNGFWSPTTTTWLTSGCPRSRSSSTAGATFLPPAVTMISFLRPVIRRNPSSSREPRSPVRNQPSVRASAVASAFAWYRRRRVALGRGSRRPPRCGSRCRAAAVPRCRSWSAGQVDVGRRGRLREPVPLEDVQADAAVEVAQPLAERRAAGDRPLRLTAERGAELVQHEHVGDQVLQAQPEARPTGGVERARVDDRGLGRPLEDASLASRRPPSAPRSCRPSRTPAAPTG